MMRNLRKSSQNRIASRSDSFPRITLVPLFFFLTYRNPNANTPPPPLLSPLGGLMSMFFAHSCVFRFIYVFVCLFTYIHVNKCMCACIRLYFRIFLNVLDYLRLALSISVYFVCLRILCVYMRAFLVFLFIFVLSYIFSYIFVQIRNCWFCS